jgi:hypothetical protein
MQPGAFARLFDVGASGTRDGPLLAQQPSCRRCTNSIEGVLKSFARRSSALAHDS